MSAYIVENETINKIVTQLVMENENKFLKKYIKESINYNIDIGSDIVDFRKALLKMNIAAVEQRYKNEEINKEGYLTDYYFKPVICSKIEAVKAADCLHYQCSEGNIPATRLYKTLTKIISVWNKEVVAELPEYKAAVWG